MASKKDKFGKKVRKSLKKHLGEAPAKSAPDNKPASSSASREEEARSAEEKVDLKKLDSFVLYGDGAKPSLEKKKASSVKKPPQKAASPRIEKSSASKSKKETRATSEELSETDWIVIENEDTPEIDLPMNEAPEKSQYSSVGPKSTGRRKETMPRSRDSIYNVSTDIRLEDYTEDVGKERDYAGLARLAAGLLLVVVLAWGGYHFSELLFAPDYELAITNEEVEASAVSALNKKERVVLSAGRPVFIRFQWPPGALTSDYLRIRVMNAGREVAVMGRMAPVTVNYILFAGPLEPGKYEIVVEDRDGGQLLTRTFLVR